MSNYGIFARYYDRLTNNAEYEVRSDYISDFFNAENTEEFSVLDIACGTGSIAKCLKDKGYKVTGLDMSDDMLAEASLKIGANLIKGNMTDFSFNNSFDACICTLDSLNHLNSIQEWKSCFKSVYNSLKPGGMFIFDVNTEYKHNVILADNSFIFDEEDFFLSWDNELIEKNKVRILLDFFIFNCKSYDRFSEEIFETAYSVSEIKEALSPYFEIVGIYDELTLNPPKEDSERLYFVCKGKRNG